MDERLMTKSAVAVVATFLVAGVAGYIAKVPHGAMAISRRMCGDAH